MDQSLHLKISYKSRIIQNLFAFIMNIIILLLQKLHLDSSKKKKKTINLTLFQTCSNITYNFPRKKCPMLINVEKTNIAFLDS